jgi:hypothetical protein
MKSTQKMASTQSHWLRRLTQAVSRPSASVLAVSTLSLGLLPAAAIAQTSPAAPAQTLPADGVYLYGQTPEPEQVGAGYMVFETVNQQLVGALYMPNSSFDCFQGRLEGSELAMTITNSYTQESYPYAVALATNDAIAAAGDVPAPLSLEGFHQIDQLSENDLRILAVCKANLQPQ